MTLTYSVTKEDYYHYCIYSYDHNKYMDKQVLRVRLLYGGFIALATAVILLFQLTSKPLLYSAVLWIMSAILIANTKRSLRKTNRKLYKKQIANGHGSEFIGDYTLELLENQLILSLASRKSEIGYDAVERIGQDEHGLYVFCGTLSAVLIPLSAFRN